MSKVLDGVAWLAASHGSTLRLEAVVIRIIIIYIGYMGCHDRTELDGFRQESKLQVCKNLYLGDYFHQISARSMIGT